MLLVDNASSHGQYSNSPILENFTIRLLPKKTIAILQPLDAGLIAIIKQRYLRRLMQHGVDLIEEELLRNIYQIDHRLAIDWVYDIYERIGNEAIQNCWESPN